LALAKIATERTSATIRPRSKIGLTLRGIAFKLLLIARIKLSIGDLSEAPLLWPGTVGNAPVIRNAPFACNKASNGHKRLI
jgi:hypothetical protein